MANLWRRRSYAILRTTTCLLVIAVSGCRATLGPLGASLASPVAFENDGVLYLNSNYDDNEIVGDHGAGYSKGFAVAPGVLSHEHDHAGYDYRREFSPKLAKIYNKYLNRPTGDFSDQCTTEGEDGWIGGEQDVHVDQEDFESAFLKAGGKIEEYERANQEYLATDPRGLNFSAYIFGALLQARFNEFITQYLTSK